MIYHLQKTKITSRPAHVLRTLLSLSFCLVLVVPICLLSRRAIAQEAVGSSSGETLPPNAAPAAEPPTLETTQTAAQSSSIVELNGQAVAETPRRFHYNFVLTVRGAYDDNINLSNVRRSGDFYTSIEPVISLQLGGTGGDQTNFLNFVYAPNAYIFVKRSDADAIQHVIHLDGQRQFAKLTLSLGEDIQILDSTNLTSLTDTTGQQANIDVGQRTRENIFNTRLNGSYDLSNKTFLTGGASYEVYDYPNLISSEIVSGSLFLNYNYGAKVVFGIGGTGGYDTAQGSTPDQYFEQGNARLSYQATGKLTFAATAGIEVRQFANNSRGTYTSPVFDFTGTYQPFDGTTISLTGNRTTRNSAVISASDFTSTRIAGGIRQRLLQRVSIGFNAGYENDNYFSAVRSIDVSRSDDYYYIQSLVDLNVTRFWVIGGYYLHREDSSSFANFTFSDNQFGVRASLTF